MYIIREIQLKYVGKGVKFEGHFSNPHDVFKFTQRFYEGILQEKFIVFPMDTKNRALGWDIISVGTLSAAVVHPREIFRAALKMNAASVLLTHNHPSGSTDPSKEDIETTKRVVEAGELMGIPVLDHIIIGDDGYYSMKEFGLI